jgi:hypothetical protein
MTNIDTTGEDIDQITALMHANLFEVFNESDDERRAAAIARTYTADVEWHDDEGVEIGRDALREKAIALRGTLGGMEFAAAGPVHQTRGFGYLGWHLAPQGGEAVISGFDVALIKDGLIDALYSVVLKTPN